MPQVNDFSWTMIFVQAIFTFLAFTCFLHYIGSLQSIRKNIFNNLIYIIL